MGYLTKNNGKNLATKRKVGICIILGLILWFTAVTLWTVDPVHLAIKRMMRAEYGSTLYDALARENVGVRIHTYLFNISNAERFQEGLDSKLKVQEVGPFTYQEFRTNEFLEMDPYEGVMRYSPSIRTEFLREESVAHPEDVNITMPNVAMLSLASKLSTYSLIPRLGFNLLATRVNSKPIVSMSAQEYLWGYEEPLIKLGHTLLPGFVSFGKLGMLDRLYDQTARFFLEVSGADEDKFAIRTINGSMGIDEWGYQDPDSRSSCNSFTNAYEGISYPMELTPHHDIRLYRNTFCRLLQLEYQGPQAVDGVQGLQFRISNSTYTNNNDTRCMCVNDICRDGISDMSPCFLGLPVVLSHGHFLHADPSLYEKIEGLKPDEQRHGSSFVIEPTIGMAMETKFSIQVSIYIRDVRFNSDTSPFSDIVLPIMYFNIVQPKLTDKQILDLKVISAIGPTFLLMLEIIVLVLGIGLLAYAAVTVYALWNDDGEKSKDCRAQSVEVPLVS